MSDATVTGLREQVIGDLSVLLGRMLDRKLPDVTPDTRLFDELGLSSSKTLELLLFLEEDLDIQVDVEEIERRDLATVGSLADFVVAHTVEDE